MESDWIPSSIKLNSSDCSSQILKRQKLTTFTQWTWFLIWENHPRIILEHIWHYPSFTSSFPAFLLVEFEMISIGNSNIYKFVIDDFKWCFQSHDLFSIVSLLINQFMRKYLSYYDGIIRVIIPLELDLGSKEYITRSILWIEIASHILLGAISCSKKDCFQEFMESTIASYTRNKSFNRC